MELKIDRVSKQYKNKIAVDRFSAALHTGVTGLLGANGAGKTTLMRMICGVITPTGGEITYNGIPVSEERYRSVLGYLPQEFGCYPEFSGRDFLLYFAALKGIPKNEAIIRSEELLETVGLAEVSRKKVRTYSGGMKQRLGIAQALLNRPQVLILDEPTAGLDPMERVRFRELIRESRTGSYGARALSGADSRDRKEQYCAALDAYCLRCGAHCGPHSHDEGRAALVAGRMERSRRKP